MGLVGVLAAVLALTDRGTDSTAAAPSLAAAVPAVDPLAAPPRLGLNVPRPQLLSARADGVALWAPVRAAFDLRAAPFAGAQVVEHVGVSTPERTVNIVMLSGTTQNDGRLWVPVRAGQTAGWAPRDALGGYEAVDTHLLVDTASFTATLLRGDQVVFRAPIGVGTAGAPTPTGSFYVRSRLTRYRSPFYGPVAFGTSARATQTDWPAGAVVGIHGTSRPDLLPGRVSHGCIRMRNADILALARLMPIGTPVDIT